MNILQRIAKIVKRKPKTITEAEALRRFAQAPPDRTYGEYVALLERRGVTIAKDGETDA